MGNSVPVWAVIPAAGTGLRMRSEIPKQYLSFQGKTLIEHCLDRLLSHPEIDGAVVVLRDDDKNWEAIGYAAEKPVFTTTGGNQRHDSVYSGLTTLQYRLGNDVIALVHDAVRPLVNHPDLGNVIEAAREHAAGAILATPVADTLKRQGNDMEIAGTLSRDGLWRALTPQVFHLQPLLNALKQAIDSKLPITDDAEAVELMGHAPRLVAGGIENFKITAPGDLALAEKIWLNQRDQQDNK